MASVPFFTYFLHTGFVKMLHMSGVLLALCLVWKCFRFVPFLAQSQDHFEVKPLLVLAHTSTEALLLIVTQTFVVLYLHLILSCEECKYEWLLNFKFCKSTLQAIFEKLHLQYNY